MTAEDLLSGQYFLLDKPLDWTSFQAVNKLKYILKRQFDLPKKFKIGHAGTLDPRATGLLVVCTGKWTKKIPEIQDAPKEYRCTLKFGYTSESYDTEKPEVFCSDIEHITDGEIFSALEKFKGEIQQRPPIFSAIKIQGERAYDMARAGEVPVMEARTVTIIDIDNIEIERPHLSFTVACSKGTYIRSLAHDIGQVLGVGAYLIDLRRTKIGDFLVQQASPAYLDDQFDFKAFPAVSW